MGARANISRGTCMSALVFMMCMQRLLGLSMPCMHAGCEGTAWHIVTVSLSVHYLNCASLQDAAAVVRQDCLLRSCVVFCTWHLAQTPPDD